MEDDSQGKPFTIVTPVTALINHVPQLIDAAALSAFRAAQEIQIKRDLEPHWLCTTEIVILSPDQEVPAGVRPVHLIANCDEPGAVAYHDAHVAAFVGVQTALGEGCSWQSAASHEIVEMTQDPDAISCKQVGALIVANELCDAVEGKPYTIDGVEVENFVLPSWFRPGGVGPYDFRGLLKRPMEVAEGGYYMYMHGAAWHQVNGESVRVSKRTQNVLSRRFRRKSRGA